MIIEYFIYFSDVIFMFIMYSIAFLSVIDFYLTSMNLYANVIDFLNEYYFLVINTVLLVFPKII